MNLLKQLFSWLTEPALIPHPFGNDIHFSLEDFNDSQIENIQKSTAFSVLMLRKGKLKMTREMDHFELNAPCLVAFAPGQPISFKVNTDAINASLLRFSQDFYCIYHHHAEVGCDGLLFDSFTEDPALNIPEDFLPEFEDVLYKIRREFSQPQEIDQEMLVTLLKLFLKLSARIKKSQNQLLSVQLCSPEVQIIHKFKNLIDNHFKSQKEISFYAQNLQVPHKSLTSICKKNCLTSPSDLLQNRIILEARRELFLSSKPVKQIANELGYEDPFYFSRVFKKCVGISPENFRKSLTHNP
jgi:AraC family transcriptional regulator, transcriptional activator of pobA